MRLLRTGQRSTNMCKGFQQYVPFLTRTRRQHVLSVAKLDEILLECRHLPGNRWLQPSKRRGVFAQHEIEQNCWIHESTVVHKLYNTVRKARSNFVNWYLHTVHDGKTEPNLDLFNGEVVFLFTIRSFSR